MINLLDIPALNCYVPADIMILLDGSDSIQDRDWYKMKEFVQLLIDNFDIARDAIHLGMVVYSSRIGDHIGLNSFKDKNMLKLLAGALNHPKDSTNTAKGIEYVREKFRSDGRPGVPKIAIVITDGSSDNPRNTKLQANAAKNEGIKVLAVGVGGHMFKDELRSIASNPSKVFTSPTFGTLITLVSEIRNMVCQGLFQCYGCFFYGQTFYLCYKMEIQLILLPFFLFILQSLQLQPLPQPLLRFQHSRLSMCHHQRVNYHLKITTHIMVSF